MKEWFEELIVVFAYSTRTQVMVFAGILFSLGLLLWGDHLIAKVELSQTMKPMEEMIKQKLYHHYDKAALVVLISSWVAAYKLYKKDKKRLFRMM